MGHFSHNCKLSGVPITSGPAVLIVMLPTGKMYDNSDETLVKYGKTYMCSNDGPRMKYSPCWFPIKGDYDTYGGLENIIEDDNTKAIEEHYGLTIHQILGVITSGRKDDGFDDSLDCVIDKRKSDRNSPIYLKKYRDLIKMSGMWVHGGVYAKLSARKEVYSKYGGIGLGNPAILKSLGFKENGTTSGRFTQRFSKDGLIIQSDGNWLEVDGCNNIYCYSDLLDFCAVKGVVIDVSEHIKKSYNEQVYDYLLPKVKSLKSDIFSMSDPRGDRMVIAKTLLNYSDYDIKNSMTATYFANAKEGKLRENIREFWEFDSYMYACGKYYEIVGTGPQDGAHSSVLEVVNAAKEVLEDYIGEREGYGEDEDYE